CTESGEPVLARDWHDLPMHETATGHFTVRIPLTQVGIFAGKACFFERGSLVPQWPAGDNVRIKVAPARTACANTVYTAFVRQFGSALSQNHHTPQTGRHEQALDALGYTVIPPSGTFRDLARQLDTIMGRMRFRIVQLLPVHPVPTTFARMGRFGSAFAALDFLSVDPALAEFDKRATPLDQFRELADAVHSRSGLLFMDMPANHTGWAATLQTHHPEWYRRKPDGEFVSPGAWGVIWADLVELDYRDPRLRAYMAEVFLFWCRQGADGFRCDAGYMIPEDTWNYIVSRVREEHPDTVFLLEGLGGKVEVTAKLLSDAGLDWAYSELFQTEDRSAFDWYLPQAIKMAERCGPLIHFAETHDNSRLAARGQTYARMRVSLSALLSHQGAFGITNGVEWFAKEKVDVHNASALNWGTEHNQVAEIARLNTLLGVHSAFGPGTQLSMLQQNAGPTLAILREDPQGNKLLVLVNLDCGHNQTVFWDVQRFGEAEAWDLVTGEALGRVAGTFNLRPGCVCCLTTSHDDLARVQTLLEGAAEEPEALSRRRRDLMALRVRQTLAPRTKNERFLLSDDPAVLGSAMTRDPVAFCASDDESMPACTQWLWPQDMRRLVAVPEGHVLLVRAEYPFTAALKSSERTSDSAEAVLLDDGKWGLFLSVEAYDTVLGGLRNESRELATVVYTPQGIRRDVSTLLIPPPADAARVATSVNGVRVREDATLRAVLSNGAGAMCHARAAWGEIASQYDCLLAVNTDPAVPVDKTVFWTRCRAWLRYRGYSQEISKACMTAFAADPAGREAQWSFDVPCGMGRWVHLTFKLELVAGLNRAHLTVCRHNRRGGLDPHDDVTLILRPDIEWRSFHHKTKAFAGPEREWPAAVKACASGFAFTPQAGETASIETDHGEFHNEPEWLYMLEHTEERERGLDPNGDLFSPGWFSLPLESGGQATLTAGRRDAWAPADAGKLPCKCNPDCGAPRSVPEVLSDALSLFVVRRDNLCTVIAGYPWFLDWGRDTLIALRGMIADGRYDESLAILQEFGRFEERGTLPNIIHGNTVGNRDTSDAPLWFCVAAGDLMEAIGDRKVLDTRCGERKLREVMVSILSHYRDGTPNGIRMDPQSGLIFSPAHFTWMDTNYPAATPREGYPVEIQALWIAALQLLARKVDASWEALAEHAAHSLAKLFEMPGGWLADCLRAAPGVPAARSEMEDALRPNQLLAVTLGVPMERSLRVGVVRACEQLLTPGAIRSLADLPVKTALPVLREGVVLNDPHRPYQGQYLGDEDTRRKPAYHNGTAWSWQFPLYAEALYAVYGTQAARMAGLSLLATAVDQLNSGCLGHMPEICDGDAPHAARGCAAQAWGVSELLRVWKKIGGEA
ncbi:MAG: amylo-alpha-1,6-glucosidase, partial [Kiritimatiellae bacterium]|nr:amylo-alpha-1,6-glucosidase [Kiritimatiellia bacterium]